MRIITLCFFLFCANVLLQAQDRIVADSLSFDGKPFDEGLYSSLKAVLENKASKKGRYGVLEETLLEKEVATLKKELGLRKKGGVRIVEIDDKGTNTTPVKDSIFAFCDGKDLFINHNKSLCKVFVVGLYMVCREELPISPSLHSSSEIYWLLDTRTNKRSWLFSKRGLRSFLKQYPDLKAQYKKEKTPSGDYSAMINKDLKYMRLINSRIQAH